MCNVIYVIKATNMSAEYYITGCANEFVLANSQAMLEFRKYIMYIKYKSEIINLLLS